MRSTISMFNAIFLKFLKWILCTIQSKHTWNRVNPDFSNRTIKRCSPPCQEHNLYVQCRFPEVPKMELMHHTEYTYIELYHPEISNRIIKRCSKPCQEHHLYAQWCCLMIWLQQWRLTTMSMRQLLKFNQSRQWWGQEQSMPYRHSNFATVVLQR